jgi:CNT family concentrative nucleoside transporter
MLLPGVSAVGFLAFAGIAWLFSADRKTISWKTVAWGLALQLFIGLLVFRLPGSRQLFLWLNDAILALLNSSKSGTKFLLGPLAAEPGESGSLGFILAFQVLPVVIFFSAFTAALAPSRRDELASFGLRALLAATLATLMTACVAGMFSTGEGVLFANVR